MQEDHNGMGTAGERNVKINHIPYRSSDRQFFFVVNGS